MTTVEIAFIVLYVTGALNRFIDVHDVVRSTFPNINEFALIIASLISSIFWFVFDWFFTTSAFIKKIKN